jgi:hypothetical protein
MSGRNRKKNRPSGKAALTAPLPQLKSPAESETDKRQDHQIWSNLRFTIASMSLNLILTVIAVWSGISAAKSAAEAANANSLLMGKTQASFELVEETNRDPARFKEFMRPKEGTDELVFRIESADELMRWGPYVRVKNTGTGPIDAIRIDVHYSYGSAYGIGVKQIEPIPLIVNDNSSHEATSFGKLMPGQTVRIALAPILVNQISRLHWTDYADKDHMGIFTIRAYCRLVGATSYDRAPDEQTEVLTFHWRPAGLRPDAKHVKELLAIKPEVKIE